MTLHLVRKGATPIAVGDADWIVELDGTRRELADRATPPIAPGPLTDDQLVQLLFAADRVITW